jgi:hypothetical protein
MGIEERVELIGGPNERVDEGVGNYALGPELLSL